MWKYLTVLMAAAAVAARGEITEELEARVRAAETAFTRHLAADAVFVGGPNVFRGAAEVAGGWKRFFAPGSAVPFSWAPERVVVTATGDLAFSSGPVRNPAGARVAWKAVLDSGCPPCDCLSGRQE